MSHEALPMYTVQSSHDDVLRSTPPMPGRRPFFSFGGAPTPPQYEPLPMSEDEDELKKGLLAVLDASGATSSLSSPTTPTVPMPAVTAALPIPHATPTATSTPAPTGSASPASGSPRSLYKTIYDILWYPRMLLFLMIIGAAVAFACSLAGYFLATVFVLGWVAPTNRLHPAWGFAACAAGGPVVGAAVGAAGWVFLCATRALLLCGSGTQGGEREGREVLPVPVAHPAFTRLHSEADPETVAGLHPGCVARAAAALSVLALAVGVAAVPGARAAAGEAGFGVGLALAYGVWGAAVPFVPGVVMGVVTTLTDCDPCSGFRCLAPSCGC